MKRILALFLALVTMASFTACGTEKNSTKEENLIGENDLQNNTSTTNNIKYPKIEEISFSFTNGSSYGEPAALMKLTNNSQYTIVKITFDFVINQEATDFSAYDKLVEKGKLSSEKVKALSPTVYNYMVCDTGETVEGATCYLTGSLEATDSTQCDVFVLEKAEISYVASDNKIHTVIYTSENEGYSLQPQTKECFSWSNGDYSKVIPKPDTRFVQVDHDKTDYYQFTAYDITFEQYQTYCNSCRTGGFSNDIEDNTYSFWCTNSEGLTLNIRYFPYMNALTVEAEKK